MTNTITVYNFNSSNSYIGTSQARENPLEESEYLVPANATIVPCPSFEEGQEAVFNGSSWEVRDLPPEPEPEQPSLEEVQNEKIAQLASNRAQLAENSTVSYSGNSFANSQNARIAILRYITSMTASSTAVSYFTFPERGIVPLVKADFQALATLIEENETALRTAEVILIQEINACTTVEAVNAIDISLT